MAVFVSGTTYANLSDNTNGGAINSHLTSISGYATFTSCHATNGGAIWFDKGSVTLSSGTIFTSNSATGNGGAIFSGNSGGPDEAVISVHSVQFSENSAANGGALYFNVGKGYNEQYSNTITNCTFNGNSASEKGGAIYNNACRVYISGSIFATETDSIYNNDTLIFSGTNTIAANVTTVSGKSTTSAEKSIFNFTNSAAITIKCDFGNSNTLNFNNSGVVAIAGAVGTGSSLYFNGTGAVNCSAMTLSDIPAISIGKGSALGSTRTVATGLGAFASVLATTEIDYLGIHRTASDFTGLALDSSGSLSVTLTAHDCLLNNDASLALGTYSESFSDITLASNKAISGDSTVATITAKIYAAGNTVSMDNMTYQGIIYGGSVFSETATTGNTSLSFGQTSDTIVGVYNNDVKSRVYGGSDVEGGVLTMGDVSVEFGSKATLGNGVSIYGAGYINNAASEIIVNDITLNFAGKVASGDKLSNIYAGAYVSTNGASKSITANAVSTTISDGTFHFVGNGSRLNSTSTSEQGASSLTISGGKFTGFIYAGAFSCGGTASATSTNLTITGGSFDNYIFGGCGASSSVHGAKLTVEGDANVTIDASTGSISFQKSIFAGNIGAGTIGGNTVITLKGDGNNIVWSSQAAIVGGNQYTSGTVAGSSTLAFNGFKNNLGAVVDDSFDTVTMTGDSDVTFAGEAILATVDTWNLEADCSLNWELEEGRKIRPEKAGLATIDLTEDTLNITRAAEKLSTGSSVVLFDLKDAEVTSMGWFSAVNIDGNAAAISGSTATCGDFTLSYDSTNKQITLSRASIA